MTARLDLRTTTDGTSTVVSAEGDIDLATAPDFRDHVLGVIDVDPMRLVLDLSGVGFIDSTGIGVIVLVRRKVRVRRGELHIVASRRVRAALRLAALEQALNLHDRLADALGHEADEPA